MGEAERNGKSAGESRGEREEREGEMAGRGGFCGSSQRVGWDDKL